MKLKHGGAAQWRAPVSSWLSMMFAFVALSLGTRAGAQTASATEVDAPEVDEGDDAGAAEESPDQAAAAAEEEPLPCTAEDVDRDGLGDTLELASGTRPLRADTDGDGIPDGVEDANRDGELDHGESDPRVPGLFPGSYPHIPEPMVFDLVRGLGARRGEVEVNTLMVLDPRRGQRSVRWAPEVEWAFADGWAVELELPMHDRTLEAMKGALQLTLPLARAHLTHGLQAIGEYLLDTGGAETTALYLFGARVGSWSLLGMAGPRARTNFAARADYEVLLNPSVYYDVEERLTLGVECNVALALDGHRRLAAIPQLHWQITKAVRVQLGGGVTLVGARVEPALVARVVLE